MQKEQIIQASSKHYRKLKKDIKKLSLDYDVELFHLFRVEYKTLRAFFRMLSEGSNDPQMIKISKKLKKTYNLSGTVRDMKLQQTRVADEPGIASTVKPYIKLLQKEIEKLIPVLNELFLENPVKDSKSKTDATLPEEFPLSGLILFIKNKWATIIAIISSGIFSDVNLHMVRKCLKDIMYALNEYKSGPGEPALPALNKKSEDYFNNFLDELGNFQDRVTSIALLKTHWIKSLGEPSQEILMFLKRKWQKDKTAKKQLLVRKLKQEFIKQQPPGILSPEPAGQ